MVKLAVASVGYTLQLLDIVFDQAFPQVRHIALVTLQILKRVLHVLSFEKFYHTCQAAGVMLPCLSLCFYILKMHFQVPKFGTYWFNLHLYSSLQTKFDLYPLKWSVQFPTLMNILYLGLGINEILLQFKLIFIWIIRYRFIETQKDLFIYCLFTWMSNRLKNQHLPDEKLV